MLRHSRIIRLDLPITKQIKRTEKGDEGTDKHDTTHRLCVLYIYWGASFCCALEFRYYTASREITRENKENKSPTQLSILIIITFLFFLSRLILNLLFFFYVAHRMPSSFYFSFLLSLSLSFATGFRASTSTSASLVVQAENLKKYNKKVRFFIFLYDFTNLGSWLTSTQNSRNITHRSKKRTKNPTK